MAPKLTRPKTNSRLEQLSAFDELGQCTGEDFLPLDTAPVVPLEGVDNRKHNAINQILRAKLALEALKPEDRHAPEVQAALQSLATLSASDPFLNTPSWSDLEKRAGRNPALFIREEYLGSGLTPETVTRSAIAKRDFQLANAYGVWIRRHPEDAIWATDRTTKKPDLASKTPNDALKHRRRVDADRQARHRARNV